MEMNQDFNGNQPYHTPPDGNRQQYSTFSAAPAVPPYMGGAPVRCPRCSNVVTTRFCNFCGLDLSVVYSAVAAPQYRPTPPPQYPQMPQYQQQQYQVPVPQYRQPAPQYQPPMPQYAQMPPYYQSTAKTKSHKVRNMWIIVGVSCLFVALMLLAIFSLNNLLKDKPTAYPDRQQQQDDGIISPDDGAGEIPGGVSQEEYDKLKNGMSYAQVSSIIGGDGMLVDNNETLQGETFYTYAWQGEFNSAATIFVTFINDKVSELTVEGFLE